MIVNYKCPNCGSAMVYDEQTQKLKCDHCGTTLTVEEYQRNNIDAATENLGERDTEYGDSNGTESSYNRQNSDNGYDAVRENNTNNDTYSDNSNDSDTVQFVKYHCPDCGAEILTDEDTVATFCSFCGNPTLINDRLVGEKKPSRIIPFKINKNEAMDRFRKWTGKGILTPPEFRSRHTIEKIQGIYVPYWLYDYHDDVHMSADATRTRIERRGDTEYIYTDHFKIEREVAMNFDKIPADASEHMPDDVMERLEPFSYNDLVEFQMPYLSGFLAEKYHYLSNELKNIVENRVKRYGEDITRSTINGYSSVMVTMTSSNFQQENTEYVLMPVWMLTYRYKDKQYMFALNGQTGRLVGTRPTSKGRAVSLWIGFTVIFFILISIFGSLFF